MCLPAVSKELADIHPVGNVVSDVDTAVRTHGQRVFVFRNGSSKCVTLFYRQHRTPKNSVLPVKGFIDQRIRILAPHSKYNRGDWNSVRVVPVGVKSRTLRGGYSKSGCGVRSVASAARRPFLASPVDEHIGRVVSHAFPPDVAIKGQGAIGENRVLFDGVHDTSVVVIGGTGGNSEKSGVGVNSVESSIFSDVEPSTICADAALGPARKSRDFKWSTSLTSSSRKGETEIFLLSFRRLHGNDRGMRSQELWLTLGVSRSQSQSSVTAVEEGKSGAIGHNVGNWVVREKRNPNVVRAARPRVVTLSIEERHTHGMQCWKEWLILTKFFEYLYTSKMVIRNY